MNKRSSFDSIGKPVSRRTFLSMAAAIGASAAWASPKKITPLEWKEQRDLYPEGVASGDPGPTSVLLWTRRPFDDNRASSQLKVEIAEDEGFSRVVASATARVLAASDWTCRVLVGGLKPGRVYWYRFTDEQGFGSRIGRTRTSTNEQDARPVKFAFVSCQNVSQGAQNAYRRMIYEDQRAIPSEQLAFVLHLGDFVYEIVWYPEDRPQGMYDRRLRDIVRYKNGEKISDYHVPTDVDDYRALYRAYLHDPDLQDARARWPFVPMWDNHEFSWQGWQSFERFNGQTRALQTRKVAANQAWFEYQPARVAKPHATLEEFKAPIVADTPIQKFDSHGLGQEPNNLAAINSLTGYRALRWGRHLDLIITDQRSYRSEEPMTRPEAAAFANRDFPGMFPEEVLEILDAGRAYRGGKPPAVIRYGDKEISNFRKDEPPQTILGEKQKGWFINRLRTSRATWKIWGDTIGMLDWRLDPQNLPEGLTKPWPGAGFASLGAGDHGSAYSERGEIYDVIRRFGITGFATIAGDRHSFWAGLASKDLPPRHFDPVGVAFITGSISAPGMAEGYEYNFPKDHPLRALFLYDRPGGKPDPVMNLLMHHGVRSCLEYKRSRDAKKAREASNPDLAPHLSFLDMGGHGYTTVRVSAGFIDTEFVCVPRPLERSERADGGPLRYRVQHRARLWRKGEHPRLEQRVIEGNPGLSL